MPEQRVAHNKYVEFTYQIADENGEIIEQLNLPVGYAYGGAQQMFEKVETAMQGLKPGDTITVELDPGEAYGNHDPDLIFSDKLENVPLQFRELGAEVEMQNENGESRLFVVTSIEDETLTLDGNHPMAGKKVSFSLTIVAVRDATAEELAGRIDDPTQQSIH